MDTSSQNNYPTPASDKSDKSDNAKETTSSKLIRLCSSVHTSINERDFAFTSPDAQELIAHLSPDFMCHLDMMARPVSLEEQVAAWVKRAQIAPNWRFEATDFSATVNERSGNASVFMSCIFTGETDINLHGIAEYKWRRRRDKWELFWVQGLKSMPEPGNEYDPRVPGGGLPSP